MLAPLIRLSRKLLVVLTPLAVISVIVSLVFLDKIDTSELYPKESISSLVNKFDFSYLGFNVTALGASDDASIGGLDVDGFVIEPNNVQFKFLNSKQKHGDPKEILKINNEIYLNVADREIHEPKDYDMELIRPPADISTYQHANATIIALVRVADASAIGKTIKRFEKSFNSKFKYPYTFINDGPITDAFKEKMKAYTDAPMEFVQIPAELWDKPSSVDVERETAAMNIFAEKNVAYAKKQSYHNMCRFYSGTFYNLPELQKYKYYWRIEPNVDFYTDLNYDVFKYLDGTNKIYGFTINLYDIHETVESLWRETLKFLNIGDNYKYINPKGAFQWLLEDQQNPDKAKHTGGYSTCHFWSNFEIANMDFYRGEAYSNWFKHLDETGNFYYERWGDAPVHSIGLALFADKKDIHWFRDIGYFHDPYINCPNTPKTERCDKGKFSRWEHLADQNCMATWIDYGMDDPHAIY